jgi:hypothetical protein
MHFWEKNSLSKLRKIPIYHPNNPIKLTDNKKAKQLLVKRPIFEKKIKIFDRFKGKNLENLKIYPFQETKMEDSGGAPSHQDGMESLSLPSGDWPSTTKEAIWKEKRRR